MSQMHKVEDTIDVDNSSELNADEKILQPKPYIKIIEQPSGKSQRFRYVCEGRSAGTISGANSTTEKRTYPAIEIVGGKGETIVIASLVTNDAPYKAHPHNLVGKGKHFQDGIFRMTLKDTYQVVFENLGIQCVKKNEIATALERREQLQIDPFAQRFFHKEQPSSIDLNAVRLCFQAVIVLPEGGYQHLEPVVSEPITNKRINHLVIDRLCYRPAKVNGGDEIILLCEKVEAKDIKVRFFELNYCDEIIWEDFGNFTPEDVHKHTAIVFRTPRYYKDEVEKNARIFIQLLRPSDGATSEALPFQYCGNFRENKNLK